MQLKAVHLFFILLAALSLTCCLGSNVIEGMSGTRSVSNTEGKNNTATTYTGPQGPRSVQPNNNVNYNPNINAANSQNVVGTPQNTINGVTKDQIPSGEEDLYILKSEVVPPVCPACPQTTACPREKPCPACPPCARCPEPAFECKKVPNYTSGSDRYLPKPLLNDFSAF